MAELADKVVEVDRVRLRAWLDAAWQVRLRQVVAALWDGQRQAQAAAGVGGKGVRSEWRRVSILFVFVGVSNQLT